MSQVKPTPTHRGETATTKQCQEPHPQFLKSGSEQSQASALENHLPELNATMFLGSLDAELQRKHLSKGGILCRDKLSADLHY